MLSVRVRPPNRQYGNNTLVEKLKVNEEPVRESSTTHCQLFLQQRDGYSSFAPLKGDRVEQALSE